MQDKIYPTVTASQAPEQAGGETDLLASFFLLTPPPPPTLE